MFNLAFYQLHLSQLSPLKYLGGRSCLYLLESYWTSLGKTKAISASKSNQEALLVSFLENLGSKYRLYKRVIKKQISWSCWSSNKTRHLASHAHQTLLDNLVHNWRRISVAYRMFLYFQALLQSISYEWLQPGTPFISSWALKPVKPVKPQTSQSLETIIFKPLFLPFLFYRCCGNFLLVHHFFALHRVPTVHLRWHCPAQRFFRYQTLQCLLPCPVFPRHRSIPVDSKWNSYVCREEGTFLVPVQHFE